MGRVVAWTRTEEAAEAKASAVLARLAEHLEAEARAARALPRLLLQRLEAGEASVAHEALRRWSDGESALSLARWLCE